MIMKKVKSQGKKEVARCMRCGGEVHKMSRGGKAGSGCKVRNA